MTLYNNLKKKFRNLINKVSIKSREDADKILISIILNLHAIGII